MSNSNLRPPQQVTHRYSFLLPWTVWGLGCLFYFYESLLQVSLGVMGNELMRDFAITSQTLGMISGLYYYSYAFMQIPGGVLMDYFGPQRLLTVATLICALGAIAFGMTHSLVMASIARLMIGFGSAFAAVGTMKLAANWFPATRFAILTGIMITIGMLGQIGGETPLALLVDTYGWRNSVIVMGYLGLVLAILIPLIAKDEPDHGPLTTHHHSEDEPLVPSLLAIIKNKQLWLVALYGGLVYMATPVFCALWGGPYLMLKLDITKAAAANYISLAFVGWAVGGPLWGVFSNRIGLRKPPLYIASLGSLVSCVMFLYVPIGQGLAIQLFLFLFGFFSSAFLPAFAIAKELSNRRYVASTLSFMNMMNMIGSALAQPFVGFILDRLWQGEMLDTVRVYPLSAYQIALSIMPIGLVISLMLLPKIKETYCSNS